MGHYDAYYDLEHDKEMARRKKAREECIPSIMNRLTAAQAELRLNANALQMSSEMQAQIEMLKLALKGQLT